MIIGPAFAIGHIPKTGGDALDAWVQSIGDGGLICEGPLAPKKHFAFVDRPLGNDKPRKALSIRPLAEWTLSYLHEVTFHPEEMKSWGFRRKADCLRPSAAFLHPYADLRLQEMRRGAIVTDLLRCGPHLLGDLIVFLNDAFRPLTAGEIERMSAKAVKPPREYNRDLNAWWTDQEIEALYRMNPIWAAVEGLAFRRKQPCALSLPALPAISEAP